MFVDDGYSSNEESIVEERSRKQIKQSKLRELNRRRRHTLDDSNKTKNVNIKPSKAPVGSEKGSIFNKRAKEDEFLEELRKESNKKHTNRSGDDPFLDSAKRRSIQVNNNTDVLDETQQLVTRNPREQKKEECQSETPILGKESGTVQSIPTAGEEGYWTQELDSMWIETSLLLRVPIANAEDLIFVEASAEAGLLFMSELDDVARSLNILRGTLSRWLLPYDQNTRLDEQSSTPHSVLENIPAVLRGKLSEKQVYYLVRGANNVRRLVRIKIADDNDLEQARAALRTTMSFIKKLNERAVKFSKSPFEFIELRPKSAVV